MRLDEVLTTQTVFSNGTFQLDARVSDLFTDPNYHLVIRAIELYQYNTNINNNTDPYELIDSNDYQITYAYDPNNPSTITGLSVIYVLPNTQGPTLLKWVIRLDPYVYSDSNTPLNALDICCADVDGNQYLVIDGYAADLSQYEKNILSSIKLKCNDCEVPMDLINKILKLFTVRAAIDSRSPYLEMIFSKLMCNRRYNHIINSVSRNCNCNG